MRCPCRTRSTICIRSFTCGPCRARTSWTSPVTSEIPKEASDVANAVANRYETLREVGIEQIFAAKEHIIEREIAEQTKVVAQKSAALEGIRSQLHSQGIDIAPGAAGLIKADLAAQKSGSSAQVDALAPLRAAEGQLDAQQHALDDMQLKLRQEKTDDRLTESPVRIIALADPPEYPSAPNHALDLMIAMIEAACAAIVAAGAGRAGTLVFGATFAAGQPDQPAFRARRDLGRLLRSHHDPGARQVVRIELEVDVVAENEADELQPQ